MQTIVTWIGDVLGYVIRPCYALTRNYGLAIILFTLISKLVLLPISVWVQKNGIKLVRMQPEINRLKADYYGDPDMIAEKQGAIYKKYHYSVWASILPLVVQLLILLGLVNVIERMLAGGTGSGMMFLGVNMAWVPSERGGISVAVPVAAALSSLWMCAAQNRSQVLQSEQGKVNKYGMLIISVALSLYLGLFVMAGIGLYWIASNVFSIAQMYLLNIAIDPRKYVDYQALEESRKALAAIEELDGGGKGFFRRDENAKREKADYKRFFSIRNKHIVFYSEKSGFWKYYKDIAEELLKGSNGRIHYVTSDPEDQIFELAKKEPRILPYYIGPKKIITLMMKMDADKVVMTTPDLETFYLKRSYVRKDIEYIYTPHDPMSVHMGFREGAMDHFDTVLCVGPQQIREIRKTEEVYGLPRKNLVPCGYCLLDDLISGYRENAAPADGKRKRILIAPSWNEDNILDSCADELIGKLLGDDRLIVVRPHPEYVKRFRPALDALTERWRDRIGDGLQFETDFSSNSSVYSADALITDWSGIAYEYSYTTLKPTLFINTKVKALNPNWENIGITPLEISLRDKIGVSLNKDELSWADDVMTDMVRNKGKWREQIRAVRDENVFNLGECGKKAAEYIIGSLTGTNSVDYKA